MRVSKVLIILKFALLCCSSAQKYDGSASIQGEYRKKRAVGVSATDVTEQLSKYQLSRNQLRKYSIYQDRKFDDAVPAHFEAGFKSPCWSSEKPFPLSLLVDMALKGDARASQKGGKLPMWLRPYLIKPTGRRLTEEIEEKTSLAKYLRDTGIPEKLGRLCLPYFFLLGVAKGGTTALYEMISAHPQVVKTRKEPHWWTRAETNNPFMHYILTNYYTASKIVAASGDGHSSNMVFGDASASTFWQLHHRANNATTRYPTVPNLIKAILPNAKLIVIFRNPTERALSEYAYFIEDPTAISQERFTQGCLAQIKEFNECRKLAKHDGKDDVLECMYFRKGVRNVKMGFVRIPYGIYSRPLLYWWTVFPKSQLLVLRSEMLRNSPVVTLRSVLKHLDLAPLPMAQLVEMSKPPKSNKRDSSRSISMPPTAKKALDIFYEPFNAELAALMKDDAFLWKSDSD